MINACISCSSEEQGKSGWEMSVGLDTTRVQFQGWDWDQYNSASTNPMLLPRHCHHQHQQQHSDSEDQKPVTMTPASYREYNGMGFAQSAALGVWHSPGVRSFGGPSDGIPSSAFNPNLSYSGMCSGLGSSNYGSDARSPPPHHQHAEQQRQWIGMMNGMEQQYEKGTALVKREEGDFQARIGLNLGHRTYFSSEDMTAVSRLYKRPRAIPPGSVQVPRCQAEGCKADLSNAKHYHRRHKVCELHSKATSVVTAGLQQRFCQQCSRFHVLAEFDEVKRSCRKRLADHNRRRRKPPPNAAASSACTAVEAAALKADDEKEENGSGGLQATPILRTEAQALLNAISISSSQMPSMLHTACKGQIPPTVLQAKAQKPVPGQQYAQGGPNLSLSSVGGAMELCSQRQTTTHEDYSGLELALPWLRPCTNSEFNGTTPRPPMNILQPIISEKSDGQVVEAHANFSSSSCIQNFIPLTAASSREIGSSQWMVGGSDDPHQMFSLLEAPALRAAQDSSQRSQSRPVEYLSHHHQNQHQGVMNSDESVDGQSDAKFSEMDSLRVSFGQSVYDDNL